MRREEILKPRIFTDSSEEMPVVEKLEPAIEKASFNDADERVEFGRRPQTDKPMLGR